MKTDIRKIKDKLAKLIRLSEDGAASDGEINNALSMAEKIMVKHNLQRDDIDVTEDGINAKRVVMGRCRVFCLTAYATAWEGSLACFCVKLIGNVGHYKEKGVPGSIDKTKLRTAFTFYGSDDEVEMTVELFQELQAAMHLMGVSRYGSCSKGQGLIYCEGFVDGLREANRKEHDKLKHSNDATYGLMVQSENTSLAIVNEAKGWLGKEHGVRLSTGRAPKGAGGSRIRGTANAASARAQGHKDGKNYSVGKRSASKKLN